MAICLRCKSDPCTCARDVDARLDRAVEQFAMLPDEAKAILERLSPAEMALALITAGEERETIIVERDHWKVEVAKLGRIVYAAAHYNGGELRVPLATFQRNGTVTLDYAIDEEDGLVVVTYTEDDLEPEEGP